MAEQTPREVLAELVRLEDLRDRLRHGVLGHAGFANWREFDEAEGEYQRCSPLAWAAARALLARPERGREEADRVSIHGMYDCHLFHDIGGATVEEVIANWRAHNRQMQPAIVGGKEVSDLGPSELCPIIVLSGDRELRRVGPMVFSRGPRLSGQCNEDDLKKWRDAALADPDISRLLAAPSQAEWNERLKAATATIRAASQSAQEGGE